MGTELGDLVNVGSLEVSNQIGDIKKNGFSLGKLFALIQSVVKVVENFSQVVDREVTDSQLKGEAKQDLAVRIINENVDIPFIPEFMEGAVIKFFIDRAVAQFNKLGVFKNA